MVCGWIHFTGVKKKTHTSDLINLSQRGNCCQISLLGYCTLFSGGLWGGQNDFFAVMWPNVINTGSPLFRGDWTQDYDLSSIPHRRIKSSKNILRPIRHRLRRARRTQSDLLSVLTMHRLASPERVDRVSHGLHRICIAFQVALNWSVTSASVSVEPEKQRSSHCLFPMSWSYMNVCRGGGQELDCAAETASPLMPASGRKSHRALP